MSKSRSPRRGVLAGYAWALVIVVLCTLAARAMRDRFDSSNLIMVYLLGVAMVATRFGRGAAVAASCLAVAAFDFFLVPPYLTFAVHDPQYLVTFAVMLVVALLIGDMAVRLRAQAESARVRERHTQVLYRMSQELADLRVPEEIARTAARHVAEATGRAAAVFMAGEEDALTEWGLRQPRGDAQGADTMAVATATHVPLRSANGALGMLAVGPDGSDEGGPPLELLEALARETAGSLERARLAGEADRARVEAEAERLRSALLSSVSHDLRTPLAAIQGAATALRHDHGMDDAARGELLSTVAEESDRLNRLVGNLLDMTRVEAGALVPQRDWQSVEELIGAALARVGAALDDHRVVVDLAEDLPLVRADALLVDRVLVNLLENAGKYTPAGSTITVSARAAAGVTTIAVEDDGPGLPEGSEERVFEKFFRVQKTHAGFGLGLTICKAIVEAHGGRIRAENRVPHGARFSFTLPLEAGAPPADVPEASDGA